MRHAERSSAAVTVRLGPTRSAGGPAGVLAGRAVAGVGDVDGDGIDDTLIGADSNDALAADSGAAYVIFGSPALGGDIVPWSAARPRVSPGPGRRGRRRARSR